MLYYIVLEFSMNSIRIVLTIIQSHNYRVSSPQWHGFPGVAVSSCVSASGHQRGMLGGIHLQRGSSVSTGQETFDGSLCVHTSDVPTFFYDWGQSRHGETALSAPNCPYRAQCSQDNGWNRGTSSPLQPQMVVVPSAPVPGATADTW